MKTYILTANPDCDIWAFPYDKAHAFVIRASSPTEARSIATANAGDETFTVNNSVSEGRPDAWTNPEFSTCTELTADGEEGVIMRDYHNG